jgi:hypothetical protein
MPRTARVPLSDNTGPKKRLLVKEHKGRLRTGFHVLLSVHPWHAQWSTGGFSQITGVENYNLNLGSYTLRGYDFEDRLPGTGSSGL